MTVSLGGWVSVHILRPASLIATPSCKPEEHLYLSPFILGGTRLIYLAVEIAKTCSPSRKYHTLHLPCAMLGRKALGSFKEDTVIDCYLQQITHKLLLG